MIVNYLIVAGKGMTKAESREELTRAVCEMLSIYGWEPLGAPFYDGTEQVTDGPPFTTTIYHVYCQAMIKRTMESSE